MSTKRKAPHGESERPNKKQQTATTVKVKYITPPDIAKPVIGKSKEEYQSIY
jgi:hypothetical protein